MMLSAVDLRRQGSLCVLATLFLAKTCNALMPTAGIDMYYVSSSTGEKSSLQTILATQASFGSYPYMGASANSEMVPVLPPEDDTLLCGDSYQYTTTASSSKTIMLVPRGVCPFETKARNAQQLGASAIIIYGTLGSRYGYNDTTATVIWPQNKYDYDCSYKNGGGKYYVPKQNLQFNPQYVSQVDDPLLTGTAEQGNLCALAKPIAGVDESADGTALFHKQCKSNRCLLTGIEDLGSGTMEACCAWDLHVFLYGDGSDKNQTVPKINIEAYFVTMEQSQLMLDMYKAVSSNSDATLRMLPYARPRPTYNISAVLIWGLGVFVAFFASYLSASEYRAHDRNKGWCSSLPGGRTEVVTASTSLSSEASDAAGEYTELTTRDDQTERNTTTEPSPDAELANAIAAGQPRRTNPSPSPSPPPPPPSGIANEETVELTWHHAISFLVFSSASLFILFFFKIYNVVKIMYGIGCSGALAQVIFLPFYTHVCNRWCKPKPSARISGTGGAAAARAAAAMQQQHQLPSTRILCTVGGEPITVVEFLSIATGYAIGISWIIVGFVYIDPSSIPFFWITQNVMGMSMCIVFLGLIRLNSIKVASVLLIAAFAYDIFFVFITPMIFSSSVMITVATSGGPPTADPAWCEKYPRDEGCTGGDPLPMLFTIPRLGDYLGGASLLGLGDVVLPGLLLSFACRYDAAKRLVGLNAEGRGVCVNGGTASASGAQGGGRGRSFLARVMCCCCRGGYFYPVLVAYAIGLMMANLAVYLMNMGQPALLYLVPMCLGTMCVMGACKGEMGELWRGPKVLSAADRIVNTRQVQSASSSSDEALLEENGNNGNGSGGGGSGGTRRGNGGGNKEGNGGGMVEVGTFT